MNAAPNELERIRSLQQSRELPDLHRGGVQCHNGCVGVRPSLPVKQGGVCERGTYCLNGPRCCPPVKINSPLGVSLNWLVWLV